MHLLKIFLALTILLMVQCDCNHEEITIAKTTEHTPFLWENANIYFLMTDRFYDGNPANNFAHSPNASPAPYRGFMGGDLAGVTQKIKEGYFNKLGVNAIWTTPLLENIIGSVDEGTGTSYGFHGYWTRDWTAFDPRVCTEAEFAEFVKIAHQNGIRVVMDVIINHTGPVTPQDTQWPDEWVRTTPRCQYTDYESTVTCTLVDNLPDIKTESTQEVELPPFLVEKWKKEGRYEEEVAELDGFFAATKYPRRPYYYIIKWLVDYVKKYGIDGYRVDTAKHTESKVWEDLFAEASKVFALWKKTHPEEKLDDQDFYMVGEVYNFYASSGRSYDYGDKKVDFFAQGFDALINFDFKTDAQKDYESIFVKYDTLLHNEFQGKTILNYISSHDDGGPYDKFRERPFEAGTKLLLTQGGAQIYYGDETARSLSVDAQGDATLRSFMNWEDLQHNDTTNQIFNHWCKLGTFRKNHLAIGAGSHQMLQSNPYTFSRKYSKDGYEDLVIVALDLIPNIAITLDVSSVFANGQKIRDHYSGQDLTVADGKVVITPSASLVLLEKI